MSGSSKIVTKRMNAVAAPAPSTPPMPSSSGAWLGKRTTILRKDADFVRVHADYLRARCDQSDAMRELIDSRIGVAKTMAKLAALSEIVEHEYRLGHREREHELHLFDIHHQTEAVTAHIALAEVQARLAAISPHAPALPTPAAGGGLSPDEIEEILQVLPEISPETLHTLSLMLKGRLKEKSE